MRILIQYYCKTNEHSYLYMVREYSSIIIVKQMNIVTNTWYENTYPVLLQNKRTQILIHGKRILIHYYCKENEHSY